jgi:hypothetical protein
MQKNTLLLLVPFLLVGCLSKRSAIENKDSFLNIYETIDNNDTLSLFYNQQEQDDGNRLYQIGYISPPFHAYSKYSDFHIRNRFDIVLITDSIGNLVKCEIRTIPDNIYIYRDSTTFRSILDLEID